MLEMVVVYSTMCPYLCVGLDIPIYEEVEAYTGMRPVLVFGALADQVVSSLMESYPHIFYSCRTGE